MNSNEISEIIRQEFGQIADRFEILDLTMDKAAGAKTPARAGVYVFWKGGSVIKVGRHLQDPKKRALEHIGANTGGTMKELGADPACHLLLLIVKEQERDIHWPFALEVFLERKLQPTVKADRLG